MAVPRERQRRYEGKPRKAQHGRRSRHGARKNDRVSCRFYVVGKEGIEPS